MTGGKCAEHVSLASSVTALDWSIAIKKGEKCTGFPYCARDGPLPLLPSGPGGVGGIASRRTRHILRLPEAVGETRIRAADRLRDRLPVCARRRCRRAARCGRA